MTRFLAIALLVAGIATPALADNYITNDKGRRIAVVPAAPATVATPAKPAVAQDRPSALSGKPLPARVQQVNDKGRRI